MDLIERIKKHEGYRRFAYLDHLGNPTIGFGTRIDEGGYGIPEWLAERLLVDALDEKINQLCKHEFYMDMDPVRQGVIDEMAYQMGARGVLSFRKMIRAIESKDFEQAAAEMLLSKWHDQTPARAEALAKIMRSSNES